MARTNTLGNFLTDVANAIRDKKGTTGPIQASNFDTEIASIESGGGKYAPRTISFREYTGTELDNEIANLDTSNMTSMSYMFYNCSNLTHLDLSNFDTSNVTSFQNMFNTCRSLETLNLDSFTLNNTTNDVYYMFGTCSNLKNISWKNLKSVKSKSMANVFYNCAKLESIDLSVFDPSTTTTMTSMCHRCSSLKSVNFGDWNKNSTTTMSYAFMECTSLEKIDLSNLGVPGNANNSQMFYGCTNLTTMIIDSPNVMRMSNANMLGNTPIATGTGYVYVPDNLVDSYKTTTNWSTYADQIKPLSELPTEE